MIRTLLIVIFAFLAFTAFAQTGSKDQLALQYYNTGDYSKAVVAFEELFHSDPGNSFYYTYYLDCLIKTNDLKTAETELKKLTRRFPSNPVYAVDLGFIYKSGSNKKKQEELYREILKNLPPVDMLITQTASAFSNRGEYNYAIETYLKGRKLTESKFAYAYSLAELYYLIGNIQAMTAEYLNILSINPSELSIVEDKLQDPVQDDSNYQIVKQLLILELQKSEYHPVMVHLLTWLFVQKQDFESAFRQQKALDKRFNSNNQGLLQLADICLTNRAYDVTEEIYKYILEKGPYTPYYHSAKFGLIEVKYLKVTSKSFPTHAELLDIENAYTEYLEKDFFKYTDITEKVILRLAEIKASYLGKYNDAINLLLKYINIPQLSREARAKMKLSLGDYYILAGDVWEASLVYKQVDLDFKDHPLGHEARFRNARLSFFRGEFQWASSQLDVLKASTSELIANDALQLSLLIQDALAEDSNEVPLQYYAKADLFIFTNQPDSANLYLDSLLLKFPAHSLTDQAIFSKAMIALKKGFYDEALKYFSRVYTDFADGILADDAIYQSALIYGDKLGDKSKAMELYEKIIIDHPESVYSVDARKKYRAIREPGIGS